MAETPTNPPRGEQAPDAAQEVPAAIDYQAVLLALLGLEESADQAAIDAKATELKAAVEKAGGIEALQTQLNDAQGKLTTFEAEAKTRRDTELDAQLADYDLDPEDLTMLRELDDAKRARLMMKLPKKAKAAEAGSQKSEVSPATNHQSPAAGAPPPKPMHDPKREAEEGSAEPSEEQIAAAIGKRAKELKSAQPGGNFRDLWSQAEKEVRAKVVAKQPI